MFLPGREGGRRIGRRLWFGYLSFVRRPGASDMLFPLFPYGLPFHALARPRGRTAAHWRLRRKLALLPGKWGQDGAVLLFSEDDPFRVLAGQRGVMYRRPGLLRRICRGLVHLQITVRVFNTPLPEGLTGPAQLPASGGSRGGEGVHSVCLYLFLRRHGGVGLLAPALPRQFLPELCRYPTLGGQPWVLSALLLDLIAGSSLPWLSHGLPPSTLDRPGPPRSRP